MGIATSLENPFIDDFFWDLRAKCSEEWHFYICNLKDLNFFTLWREQIYCEIAKQIAYKSLEDP